MAAYFFDSSALVKSYVLEVGTAWVQNIVDPAARNEVFVLCVTQVEVASAIVRRRKNGLIDAATCLSILAKVKSDFQSVLTVFEVTDLLVRSAVQVVIDHELRAYDAMQLAACDHLNRQRQNLALTPATFVSSDVSLNAVAATIGIAVQNPSHHP